MFQMDLAKLLHSKIERTLGSQFFKQKNVVKSTVASQRVEVAFLPMGDYPYGYSP